MSPRLHRRPWMAVAAAALVAASALAGCSRRCESREQSRADERIRDACVSARSGSVVLLNALQWGRDPLAIEHAYGAASMQPSWMAFCGVPQLGVELFEALRKEPKDVEAVKRVLEKFTNDTQPSADAAPAPPAP